MRKWFTRSDIITSDQQRAWFASYEALDNDYVYVIEVCEEEEFWRPIGQISLYKIDWKHKRAEYGRVLCGDKQFGGRGLFFQASRLLIDFWSKEHGIQSICLVVKASNERAKCLYDRLGFIAESENEEGITMVLNLPAEKCSAANQSSIPQCVAEAPTGF